MRTHLNQHLNGLIQNSVELRERRLLIFGMRSLSVLQVIFLFVSGAFAFRYVALASTRHSNVAVVTHKSHALIGSNSSYHNGINSSNENAIDSDGHANVVKSISSLLSESLNKSIGHFKYIQEIDENTNKVNLSTIAFNETTPTSTTPCKQSVNYDDNGSSSSSSEQREPTKVSLYPDRRNHTRTTIPMTNYAEDLPKQEVTTNLPMITIDLEEDLRESRRDEAKTELKDVKDVVPTVDLRLVNHSTLVKVPVNRVKIRNRWNSTNTVLNETRFDDDYEPTSNQGPRKSPKPEDTPLFPFGARFLSDSFRKTEAISLTKPDKSPSGYQTSIHYVQSPPQSLSHKLSTTDLTHHSEHTKNSTKFICVEIINGQVRHPLFHKEVFPELHTPSLIMPTIPRVPMKYETYVSYNLHHANKSDSDLTTAADRTERERSKFYADQYRPINLDSIEYLRKYPELAKHKENGHKLTDDTVRTSYSRNYDPKSGYIPVSSKLSVENLGSSNPGSSPSSSQVSSTKQIKIEPIVKTGPGIVLPGAPNHLTRSKNSLKTQKQLSSSIDIKHHQHQPPKVPAKPEEYSVEGVTDEDDPDDIPVDIPNHSSFNEQSMSVPTPIPPSPLLGLMDTMHDQKTLSELLNSHDLLNHHDLSINPLTDPVENRPTSDYLVKQYNSLKSPSIPHSMKDTIAHYNALNRPLTSPYKLSSPEHGIIYYEPQYGFNHDPAMISPYLASIQGTFAQHKNAKSNKKSKSRRTKPSTGSRQSRFLSRVTPEDYKNYNRHFPTISGNSNNKLMYPYGRLSPSAQSVGNKYFLVPSIPAALTAKSAKRKRNSGKVKRNENRRSSIDQMSNSPSVAESIDMPVKCLQDGGNCLSSPSDMNNRRNMIKFELKDALSRT